MKKDQDQNSTDSAEIEALIIRIERGQLRDEDTQLLARLLRLLLRLITLLQHKNASLSRLKRLLFGPRSDTRVKTNPSSASSAEGESDSASSTSTEQTSSDTPRGAQSRGSSRKGGHGRMGAEAYTGARLVWCRDAELKPGVGCPHDGCRGKLYNTKQPAILIRLTGQPLVGATRYEQEVLRCSACQERFTAPLPMGVKPEKYDETCDVSLALAKYGAGLPWYRLARLQESFGVPLPESIQFERCEAVADAALPVFLYLRRLAADGEVIYSDDTRVRILSCLKENKDLKEEDRRGTQTSGLVIEVGGRKIAIYANSRRHAGENIDELLKARSADLGRPIQMADALAANWSGQEETVEAKCLAHARRKFIDIEGAAKRNGEPPLEANPCTVERDITLLSVVGSILTFEDHFFASCEQEAHPAGNTRYTAIDLTKPGRTLYSPIDYDVDTTKPGKVVQLIDLFDDWEVSRALTADAVIGEFLKNRLGDPPRKLSELPSILGYGTEIGCSNVSGDLLTRFAFHHVEGKRVAVRLGLSGCGTCRECLTQIGILLPIPGSLSKPLALAEARKEGFLLKDMKKILRGRGTKFVFRSKG